MTSLLDRWARRLNRARDLVRGRAAPVRAAGEERADDLAERVRAAGLPADVAAEAARELERLRVMLRMLPDAQQIEGWLRYLTDLPWSTEPEDPIDVAVAERVLDAQHVGLAAVKARLLEHLAVEKLRRERGAPPARAAALLFVGPPGTGKTSIAAATARALGREYVRVALGGARDEADIRGHRRTYVGALPGRIVDGIRRARSARPVMVLDEIDKISDGGRGDPAAALLEVLDPAQNHAFVDHYLGVPFDLSRVFFIATANDWTKIPPALFDRLEPITFGGYAQAEKLEIARTQALPRERERCGLRGEELVVAEEALEQLVATAKEPGVRDLERAVALLCRRAARRVASGEPRVDVADQADLAMLLAEPAWTQAAGG